MFMKLMYITNQPEVARIAEAAGVDRIFVDMEWIGKTKRQGGMDTVQSKHSIEDIAAVRQAISHAQLLVRCNPIHDATEEYCSSEEEIHAIIKNGADIIMLPYFKSLGEVQSFLRFVKGRVKTMLLVETPEAAEIMDDILALDGIDEILIGLNDMSLGYKKKFIFELLTDGTVEHLCLKCKRKGIPYGFGGIAAPGKGVLPAEYIIREHYLLGSTCAILSRSFCNTEKVTDLNEIAAIFNEGIKAIRSEERYNQLQSAAFFEENRKKLTDMIQSIVQEKVKFSVVDKKG